MTVEIDPRALVAADGDLPRWSAMADVRSSLEFTCLSYFGHVKTKEKHRGVEDEEANSIGSKRRARKACGRLSSRNGGR